MGLSHGALKYISIGYLGKTLEHFDEQTVEQSTDHEGPPEYVRKLAKCLSSVLTKGQIQKGIDIRPTLTFCKMAEGLFALLLSRITPRLHSGESWPFVREPPKQPPKP